MFKYEMINDINQGETVLFIPDNRVYEVEAIDRDVAYLIDDDGSSFTATREEMQKL